MGRSSTIASKKDVPECLVSLGLNSLSHNNVQLSCNVCNACNVSEPLIMRENVKPSCKYLMPSSCFSMVAIRFHRNVRRVISNFFSSSS